jgi:hypothetical protein
MSLETGLIAACGIMCAGAIGLVAFMLWLRAQRPDDTETAQRVLQANVKALRTPDAMRLWQCIRDSGGRLMVRMPDGQEIELEMPETGQHRYTLVELVFRCEPTAPCRRT